ncbi:Pleiotropic drug resistance protein [Vigna angularis]|uniref:Pleiotropic drug resistance protein n=1 Tax=Phaseolus angularis TaxID=3914 RepID=A0A8T0L5B6_PHAAN|nr:Pleiotropic drug resistance protein [Vigna angularis]
MAQLVGADEIESLRIELAEIGRSIRSSFRSHASSFQSISSINPVEQDDNEETEGLQWAELQRLPTCERITSALFDVYDGMETYEKSKGKQVVDVTRLGAQERHMFIEKLIKHIENDNLLLLQKLRKRIDKVGIKLPTVEVRYHNLCVEAECRIVKGKPIPTLWNTLKEFIFDTTKLSVLNSQDLKISIIKHVSGIIKPRRMTLLLGPPASDIKLIRTDTTLDLSQKAEKDIKLIRTDTTLDLSQKAEKELNLKFVSDNTSDFENGKQRTTEGLKVDIIQGTTETRISLLQKPVQGDISYNGHILEEFIPQKSSAYVSQYDLHIPEMTVRETIDFSARCQGVGSRAELLMEVSRREKDAGIVPDPDLDAYMKILGLDICADTLVGDPIRRGISGGQKKRLTTGEMIVGPTKALFMDEISNGLDSSTTFQIISCIQHLVHITDATALISLLQPAPETFDLFDDVILMAEGKIVYHGPRDCILEFFEECGFKCPQRKGTADFLQEVISKKDQARYWTSTEKPYSYVSIDRFIEKFKDSPLGKKLEEELLKPFDKSQSHNNDALVSKKFSLSKWELFKACIMREILLMKRNSFVYVFKSTQLVIVAFVAMTVFIRTRMAVDVVHGNYFMGSLFYSLVILLVDGFPELSMTVSRLAVIYKQKELCFFPAWAYTIPSAVLKIPLSLLESFIWTSLSYYVIGYSPEIGRFFRQFLLLFVIHMTSVSMFRFIASIFQTVVASVTFGTVAIVIVLLFGGFIIPKPYMPSWLRWGFWVSPVSYGEIGLTVNEFLAPRWEKMSANSTMGQQVLDNRGLNFDGYFYWISIAALIGFTVLFNVDLYCNLHFGIAPLAPARSRTLISSEKHPELQEQQENNSSIGADKKHVASLIENTVETRTRGLVLPFQPLAVAFHDVQYYVDTPLEMRNRGFTERRLQLLSDITGSFRPGILTALMGVSGAGKTTLMDVLCGRKTGGIIEGEIRIGGYPKVQETFARVSGYCEQNDIHSPNITVEESVVFSAWLRLPSQIDAKTKAEFVNEVIHTIELDGVKDSLVGMPNISGLSTEQRKRLTIAIELVANPSIIFMDEPTTGLDARAAAVVMRAVKNVVGTGRTVACTIHQPSIDIFEAFDELILMKAGGRLIYAGPLGKHSSRVIEYFERIPGVQKIKDNYNPSTWMLEVTSRSAESELGVDFAQIYRESALYEQNKELVEQLSTPPPDSRDLYFPSHFPQNGWEQFKACLWKQHLSYWRSPSYNLTRIIFVTAMSLLFGILFWKKGKKINSQQDLFNVFGAMYSAVLFFGINNCSSVLPYVATERSVLYREKYAGMYSPWAYSFAQVLIEVPYLVIQAVVYVIITYPMLGYDWSAYKVFWSLYSMFCNLLYFNYLGMLLVSLTPNVQLASIVASSSYTMLNLFCGYFVPRPVSFV